MADPFPRDGTSQAARVQPALDPAYVSVDERSIEDFVAFAREFSTELVYYGSDNEPAGDWGGFIPADLDLAQVRAFTDEPGRFEPDRNHVLFRPHFVLFLTFLKLLERAQGALNDLTRRHLEFYYQSMLKLELKPAVPDRVHLLLDLAIGADPVRLLPGARFSAGADSAGRSRIYETDREIIVTRAQIENMRSIFVDRRVTGIREAREAHRGDSPEAAMAMFEMALGRPAPGDRLPSYPAPGGPRTVDFPYLLELEELVRFAETGLRMTLWDLRSMMELKLRRDGAKGDWRAINRILANVARRRDPRVLFQPADPRDFDANFVAAVGGEPDFSTLPEVSSVTDLYHHRLRQDVQEFITNELFFARVESFNALMRIKVRIDGEWKEINRLLELAGRPGFRFGGPRFDPTDFDTNLAAALGRPPDFSALDGITDIDAYYAALLALEGYSFLLAEEFEYVMSVAERPHTAVSTAEWETVDRLLAAAHRERTYELRRMELRRVHRSDGVPALLYDVLGETPTEGEPPAEILDRLAPTLGREADGAFLVSELAASRPDWDRVYRVLEIAKRNREALPEPVAEKIEWLNVYPAPDATDVEVSLGIEGEDARWRTFGRREPVTDPGTVPDPVLGWAITSPLLTLSEGSRTVTLTLGFRREGIDPAAIEAALTEQEALSFEASTEKGWITPTTVEVTFGDYATMAGAPGLDFAALEIHLVFDDTLDPIAPTPDDPLAGGSWPVIRLMLRQVWDSESAEFVSLYPPLAGLRLERVHAFVRVEGLATLQLQNDATTLNPKKPFHPFGPSPTVGSRFHVGHPELVNKRLELLEFHVEWMGLPADLLAHYANYGLASDAEFTTEISLIDRRAVVPLSASATLFPAGGSTDPHTLAVTDVPGELPVGFRYERAFPDGFDGEVREWTRYFRWELNDPDLQHQAYPRVASTKSTELAAAIASLAEGGTINAALYQVNPPYTPEVKGLTVTYETSIELDLSLPEASEGRDRIFHVHPFGHAPIEADRGLDGLPFLPAYDDEGELLIGLADVEAPQTISILFQAAEGSADPDLEREPVTWSYLDGDRWVSLDEGNVRLDTTRGLINSGIIELALEEARPSTRLPAELYWIRATIAQSSYSVCDTVAFHTQGITATLIDNDNAPDHYSTPLPQESITRISDRRSRIARVRQPYTSYSGRMAEAEEMFNTRVSERLRHKGRAVTCWDYERLVLEEFPEIYKVKCVPASMSGGSALPGDVDIVVIPDIRDKLPFDPFEPKAPSDVLARIEEFLVARVPPSANVRVRNPSYVAIKIRISVRFTDSGNDGFFKQLLNEELNRFLSPWAYEEGSDIAIGGRIYSNSIIDFLDRRDYVDFVADIKLFESDDGENFSIVTEKGEGEEGYYVDTKLAAGVLVAAREHEIDVIPDAEYEEELFTGINYMKIELDFVVGEDEA